MTVEEEYYNVYLPQKWAQDYIERNIRSKMTSEEYEFIGKFYMCKVIGEIKAEIEEYKSRQLTLAIGVDDLEKGKQIALEYVLAILDKYKAEREDKDASSN